MVNQAMNEYQITVSNFKRFSEALKNELNKQAVM